MAEVACSCPKRRHRYVDCVHGRKVFAGFRGLNVDVRRAPVPVVANFATAALFGTTHPPRRSLGARRLALCRFLMQTFTSLRFQDTEG
uniref:Uncharacterized protein n=1 Tax=Hyaloperonospora arabidopsidis (strain Emoy2) TaxID=559515 RepID=M4C0I5_HYAAE